MAGEFRDIPRLRKIMFSPENRRNKIFHATHKYYFHPYANQPTGIVEVHV